MKKARSHAEIKFEVKKEEEIMVGDSHQKIPVVGDSLSALKPMPKKPRERKGKEPTGVTPVRFWEQYGLIKEMRKDGGAPVDTMGCESLADRESNPKVFRYQTLISLMLSAQTRDQVTAEAMRKLKEHGLTIESILQTPEDQLAEIIKPVGFYRNKAKYIKKTTQVLRDQWGGDIPDTAEGLQTLPGVGPKMAHITMDVAWDRRTGIGVDVHVHRICNRLTWVKTDQPEETRKELESWLPYEEWGVINKLLVGFGQTICQPLYPKCHSCQLQSTCAWSRNPQNQKAKGATEGQKKSGKRKGRDSGESSQGDTSVELEHSPLPIKEEPVEEAVKMETLTADCVPADSSSVLLPPPTDTKPLKVKKTRKQAELEELIRSQGFKEELPSKRRARPQSL